MPAPERVSSAANGLRGSKAHFKCCRQKTALYRCGRSTIFREASAVKWTVIVIFAIAALTGLLRFESKERNHTPAQKMALLVISLAAWALVVVLGAIAT